MPRKAIKSSDEIFDVLQDLHVVNNEGRVFNLKSPVWNEAHIKLNKMMSVKYIYLYVSQNRNGILDRLLKHYGITLVTDTSVVIDTSRFDESNESNWSMQSSNNILSPLRVKLHISDKTWRKIAPVTITYKNRMYKTLSQGWTDEIATELWNSLKLPCCFSFKNAKCNDGNGIYLRVWGKCTECNNKINVYSVNKPTEDGLDIYVSTNDTTNIKHNKKRQLRGIRRANVVKELCASSVYSWRKEKANELMQFGDLEPAHLYKETVLRKAKQIEKDRNLGLINVSDPVISIGNLKYKTEFAGCIRDIGMDKLFVMYWSNEQIFLYNKFIKQQGNITRHSTKNVLSIDATGSLIRRITRQDGSSNVIFLYQVVAPFNGKILPICQLISERHDTNMLSFWLREWLRTPVPCPPEIVTDYSLALLNAISLAFNNTDLNTYVDQCMTFLETSNYAHRPKCIIRLDIAHLVKQTCRWKCFDDKHMRVKDFYIRCIALLTKCTVIEKFRQICRDILIVAYSENEDISTNTTNNCFNAQQKLIQLIKNDETLYTDYKIDTSDENVINDLDDKCGDKITVFLQYIESESVYNNTGERPNPYWCPEFGRNLLKIAKHFPLWTEVMSTGIASSACSEEYFRELKQLIFQDTKCIRVDKFLVTHIRSLSGAMKILHANDSHEISNDMNDNNETVDINKRNISCIKLETVRDPNESDVLDSSETDTQKLKINSSIDSTEILLDNTSPMLIDITEEKPNVIVNANNVSFTDHGYLNETENWKGKNNNVKSRGKYLTNCPDIESIHSKPKFITTLPLLKNGLTLGPVTLEGKPIMVINTCPFDAVAQVLLAGYCDWTNFHLYLEQTENSFLNFIKHLSTSRISVKIYKERAIILNKFITPVCGTLNCTYNISHLISNHLLKSEYSFKINLRCPSCQYTEDYAFTVIDINVKTFYTDNMRALEKAINDRYSYDNRTCVRCNHENIDYFHTCGYLLFVDIECLQWPHLAKSLNIEQWEGTFTLSQIPTDLQFHECAYKLLGVIEYEDALNQNNAGHYIAHVRRIAGRWETYNDICRDSKPIRISQRAQIQNKKLSLLIYIKT